MVQSRAVFRSLLGLFGLATAQQAGEQKKEVHVPITFATCTKALGCTSQSTGLTMDAQWRWTHDAHPNKWGNCINGLMWDKSIVEDGPSAATYCALEGMDADHYKRTYGVSTVPGGVQLNYKQGQSIGSRLYMMEDTNTYKMFKLLNKEFTFDVDVSTLECGLNGAVYLVEMDSMGGLGQAGNKAGAKFGTGYCDAQCPHDLKFIAGEGNVEDWHITSVGPMGRYGSCCSEMDIWEANKYATAFTTHACKTKGPLRCEDDKTCGDTPPNCRCCAEDDCPCCGRYKGVCDKDGCDYNSFRLGNETFFGEGPSYVVDSSKPVTIVTQFLTADGTDMGDLVEIRRLYVQNGKLIKNSEAVNLKGGVKGDSLSDELCVAQKKTFKNPDDFTPKGGLKGMGEPLKRGMALVLSLWDDELTEMVWLDAATVSDKDPISKPGVKRGPCSLKAGDPDFLRTNYPEAHVKYYNFMVGEIGSTYGAAAEKVKNLAAAPMQDVAVPAPPVAPPPIQAPPPLMPAPAPTPIQVLPPVASMPQVPGPVPKDFHEDLLDPGQMEAPADWAPGGWESPATLTYETMGGPACCSSSTNPSDPCGSCNPGSAITEGWCVDEEEHCTGNCGGKWCPSGIIKGFEQPKDLQDLPLASAPRLARFTTWFAVPPLLLVLLAAAWARRALLQHRQPVAVEAQGFLAEDGGAELEGVLGAAA